MKKWNDKKFCYKPVVKLQAIRKVKAVSPSPFYDGKYHPPLLEQLPLLYTLRYDCKLQKHQSKSYVQSKKLCTSDVQNIKCVIVLFSPLTDPQSPGTSHLAHNNLQDKQRHIVALHENPGTQCICLV